MLRSLCDGLLDRRGQSHLVHRVQESSLASIEGFGKSFNPYDVGLSLEFHGKAADLACHFGALL